MSQPAAVIASTVLAGPVFCGWICPTGTIQEIFAALRLRLLRGDGRPSRWQKIALGLCALGFFAAAVWMSLRQNLFIEDSSLHWAGSLLLLCYLVLIGMIDDLAVRSLRLLSLLAIFVTAASHLSITSPVHFAFTARGDPASMVATGVIALASLFVMRSFCRYLCPWGYLSGFLHRFSRLQIQGRDHARCQGCSACNSVCDVAAVDRGRVRTDLCQMCYACVDRCPAGVLEVRDVWQERAAGAVSGAVSGAGRGDQQPGQQSGQ